MTILTKVMVYPNVNGLTQKMINLNANSTHVWIYATSMNRDTSGYAAAENQLIKQ